LRRVIKSSGMATSAFFPPIGPERRTTAGVAQAGTGLPVRLSWGRRRLTEPLAKVPGGRALRLSVDDACHPAWSGSQALVGKDGRCPADLLANARIDA
jgi:ribosomal protein L31